MPNTTFFLTNTEPRINCSPPAEQRHSRRMDMSKLSQLDSSDVESSERWVSRGLGSPSSFTSFISVDDLSAESQGYCSHAGSPVGASFSVSPSLVGLAETSTLGESTENDNNAALVMPRVPLPSRKPFTNNGLKLGKLKILVAGDTGVGKSQLVRAITQTYPDFVHVDECETTSGYNSMLREASASTKPRPLFWLSDSLTDPASSISSSSGTGRRQSIVQSGSSSESILDRNISFVDSCGYGQGADTAECIDTVIQYLEDKFHETANLINISNPQALNLLTSSSSLADSPHIDVCFYLILDRLKQVDLEYMERISEYAPIVPLIAKSDLLPQKEVLSLKLQILREMKAAKIDPFLFDTPIDEAIEYAEKLLGQISDYRDLNVAPNGENDLQRDKQGTAGDNFEDTRRDSVPDSNSLPPLHPLLFPTAICSLHRIDEEMLASILMSANYTPALVKSELQDMCAYVFSEQGAAWLRYNAAKRFINWCMSTDVASALQVDLFLPSRATASRKSLVHVQQPKFWMLPDFANTPACGPDRAQKHTARWAMQVEHASRAENALQLRSRSGVARRSRLRSFREGRTGKTGMEKTSKPKHEISRSVANLDPLGLRYLPKKLFNYAVKAVAVILGIRVVSLLMSKVLSGKSAQLFISVPQERSESLLGTALSSLGGGWSILA